jgi:class 3 adenylate cyclase
MYADGSAPLVTALIALGMALAFFRADPHAPTSRALSLALAAAGVSIALNMLFVRPLGAGAVPPWLGLLALPETIAFVAIFEWILRVRRTIPAGLLRTTFGDVILRLAQALALLYGALSAALPARHAHGFIGALLAPETLRSFDFYLFAIPLELALVLAGASLLLVLNRRPDAAERVRLIALAIALPFTATGLVLPPGAASIVTALGLLIFLVGAVQYHVMQGQRGAFLARFLSPQVATLVRSHGLGSVMSDAQLEISVVCCDLRGFTAYVEHTSSEQVIAVLRDYHAAVNEAATRHEATIKDYAGDGILILVGAPLPLPDAAQRAIEMARRIRSRAGAALERRQAGLGIAIGVASGPVTVGVVGGAGRLEYAAVGPAVNLAARLCEHAQGGEILVDAATVGRARPSAPGTAFLSRTPVALKGIDSGVAHYALAAEPA